MFHGYDLLDQWGGRDPVPASGTVLTAKPSDVPLPMLCLGQTASVGEGRFPTVGCGPELGRRVAARIGRIAGLFRLWQAAAGPCGRRPAFQHPARGELAGYGGT